jgi:hypothetical protein
VHSHPIGVAEPSKADLAGAPSSWLDKPFVIVSRKTAEIRAFTLSSNRKSYAELEVRIVPDDGAVVDSDAMEVAARQAELDVGLRREARASAAAAAWWERGGQVVVGVQPDGAFVTASGMVVPGGVAAMKRLRERGSTREPSARPRPMTRPQTGSQSVVPRPSRASSRRRSSTHPEVIVGVENGTDLLLASGLLVRDGVAAIQSLRARQAGRRSSRRPQAASRRPSASRGARLSLVGEVQP